MMQASHRNLICDTIDEIGSLKCLSEIGARFADAVAQLGFSALGIAGLPPPQDAADPVILTEKTPPGYRGFYSEEKFYAVNPIGAYARTACKPFRFTEAPRSPQLSQRQERFMQAMASYGMGKGIVVPIGYFSNMPACVWLAGDDPELDDDAVMAVQSISLFAASKTQALSPCRQHGARTRALTEREREVLQWASVGKSAWEIGEILGIAKRTVDEHVQTACRKLNAVNRTQAVVAALRDGLISL
jgi:LuxR family quorum sensing-dependent transcriptional regulator